MTIGNEKLCINIFSLPQSPCISPPTWSEILINTQLRCNKYFFKIPLLLKHRSSSLTCMDYKLFIKGIWSLATCQSIFWIESLNFPLRGCKQTHVNLWWSAVYVKLLKKIFWGRFTSRKRVKIVMHSGIRWVIPSSLYSLSCFVPLSPTTTTTTTIVRRVV